MMPFTEEHTDGPGQPMHLRWRLFQETVMRQQDINVLPFENRLNNLLIWPNFFQNILKKKGAFKNVESFW